jgi:FkbM family methyltransferase
MIRKLKRLLRYYKAIEGLGSCLCILDKFLKRKMVRMIRIEGTNIYVRTNTSDLDVAISSLCKKEYDHIRSINPKIIIDAGANIGTSAIFFAKKYPNARIIAVEPEESNFDLLLKNTGSFKNIVALKAAIWGVADKRTIHNRFTGHWGYTVADTHNKKESTGQEINCITIKSLMEEYSIDTIDLLKMDIQGGEKNVLENSSEWINSVEIMTVELHDKICMGCDRAFYLSTKDFKTFEKHGEKVTAYKLINNKALHRRQWSAAELPPVSLVVRQ